MTKHAPQNILALPEIVAFCTLLSARFWPSFSRFFLIFFCKLRALDRPHGLRSRLDSKCVSEIRGPGLDTMGGSKADNALDPDQTRNLEVFFEAKNRHFSRFFHSFFTLFFTVLLANCEVEHLLIFGSFFVFCGMICAIKTE